MCHSNPQQSTVRKGSVDERRFASEQDACRKSYERLIAESEKTLDLISVVRRFPDSSEHRTALLLHMQDEERAIVEYERDRRRISALILGVSGSDEPDP